MDELDEHPEPGFVFDHIGGDESLFLYASASPDRLANAAELDEFPSGSSVISLHNALVKRRMVRSTVGNTRLIYSTESKGAYGAERFFFGLV